MTKIRKITAENMILSKRTRPMSRRSSSRLHEHRADPVEAQGRLPSKNGRRLTYLPFIRAAIQSLRQFLYRRSTASRSLTHDIHRHGGRPRSAIVPHQERRREVDPRPRARHGTSQWARQRLKPEEIQGGTFTVTNRECSLVRTPIIPQPQVAILGVGTIEKRPVVVADEHGQDALGIRTVGYLALSFDHRLIDGADADKFMANVKTTLESGEFDLG
jgi:2-oxoglutarate dehydrogenase E2 component (dihydrolipoamide succinyltransferase)